MKAFQLQHLINEILTFQTRHVAALSTSKKCGNAHGVPINSCVLLLLNLLGSLRIGMGPKWSDFVVSELNSKGKEFSAITH